MQCDGCTLAVHNVTLAGCGPNTSQNRHLLAHMHQSRAFKSIAAATLVMVVSASVVRAVGDRDGNPRESEVQREGVLVAWAQLCTCSTFSSSTLSGQIPCFSMDDLLL